MKIVVTNDKEIFAIQKEFSRMFPFLRLEVLSKSHKTAGIYHEMSELEKSKTFGEYISVKTKNCITITPEMTVGELVQQFSNLYGIGVRVFRKSWTIWLKTTLTDGWTLEEQNRQGESLNKLKVERKK